MAGGTRDIALGETLRYPARAWQDWSEASPWDCGVKGRAGLRDGSSSSWARDPDSSLLPSARAARREGVFWGLCLRPSPPWTPGPRPPPCRWAGPLEGRSAGHGGQWEEGFCLSSSPREGRQAQTHGPTLAAARSPAGGSCGQHHGQRHPLSKETWP